MRIVCIGQGFTIGGWGVDSNREIVSFRSRVRAGEASEAVWASERRFDPGAGAVRGKFGRSVVAALHAGCPVVPVVPWLSRT